MARPNRPPRTLSSASGPELNHQIRVSFDRPIVECSLENDTEGTTAANTIRVTITARDRRGSPWKERVILGVIVSATAGGAPGGAQTVGVSGGTLISSLIANQAIVVETDATGVALLDLAVVGAGTRFVRAVALGLYQESGALTWA